jgi:hypothetical protein
MRHRLLHLSWEGDSEARWVTASQALADTFQDRLSFIQETYTVPRLNEPSASARLDRRIASSMSLLQNDNDVLVLICSDHTAYRLGISWISEL